MKFKRLVSIWVLASASSLFAFSGSGSGTAGDPYMVTSAAQLAEVANDLTAYYKQTNHINISGYANWTPIGNNTTPFSGT
jgi:hypothetical protein